MDGGEKRGGPRQLPTPLSGLLLFLSVPVCYLTGDMPLPLLLPVGGLAILSAAEETVILLTAGDYDPDRKGVLWR